MRYRRRASRGRVPARRSARIRSPDRLPRDGVAWESRRCRAGGRQLYPLSRPGRERLRRGGQGHSHGDPPRHQRGARARAAPRGLRGHGQPRAADAARAHPRVLRHAPPPRGRRGHRALVRGADPPGHRPAGSPRDADPGRDPARRRPSGPGAGSGELRGWPARRRPAGRPAPDRGRLRTDRPGPGERRGERPQVRPRGASRDRCGDRGRLAGRHGGRRWHRHPGSGAAAGPGIHAARPTRTTPRPPSRRCARAVSGPGRVRSGGHSRTYGGCSAEPAARARCSLGSGCNGTSTSRTAPGAAARPAGQAVASDRAGGETAKAEAGTLP